MSGYRSGSFVGRFITKANTAGEKQLGAVAITATAGVTAWGQVSAALAADSIVTRVHLSITTSAFTADDLSYVEIGIGGTGSEVVLAQALLEPVAATSGGIVATRRAVADLRLPVRVSNGQRLAVRVYEPSVNSISISATVYGATYANLENA